MFKRSLSSILLVSLLASLLAFTSASPVHAAATVTVTTLMDENDGSCVDGDCSLRDALQTAAAGDTIDFSVTGTITLTLGELYVINDLIISGPGTEKLTISGNNTSRVFYISNSVPAVISDLTIANGKVIDNTGGGGIFNVGFLTLNNVVVSSNQAVQSAFVSQGGGIFNFKSLTMNGGEVKNNTADNGGGGIYSYINTTLNLQGVLIANNTSVMNEGGGVMIRSGTTATINNSSVVGNSSSYGGAGIMADSSLTITNSLIANNTDINTPSDGYGGGLLLSGSSNTFILTNVTISGNSVHDANNASYGGGIYLYQGTLNLNNVTISNNISDYDGAGLAATGSPTVNIGNTIIGNNTATNSIYEDCLGPLNSLGHNLIQVTAGCAISGDTTGNITGQSPLLNPLADNGGPTKTQALLFSSPAKDAGDDATCEPKDQRGTVRTLGTHCDIGAFEYDNTASPVVSFITRADANPTNATSVDFNVVFSDEVTGVDLGDFMLTTTGVNNASLTNLNGSGSTYTVTVDAGSGNGTIRLDVVDDDSIEDLNLNKLGGSGNNNGDFSSGEVYDIDKTFTATIESVGAEDGWVLESSETSNVGGSMNSTSKLLYVGDNAQDKQYKSVLSFDTSSLPTGSDIQTVELKIYIKKFVGGNMFTPKKILKPMVVDISDPYFGIESNLLKTDFEAGASLSSVGKLKSAPAVGWYTITLDSSAFQFINVDGTTQLRLRFKKDDNDDMSADYLQIFSGDADVSKAPQLVIVYNTP